MTRYNKRINGLSPGWRLVVNRIVSTNKPQTQLGHRDRAVVVAKEELEAPAFETATEQVEPPVVATQGSELTFVTLDEHHHVTVVGVEPETPTLREQPVPLFPKIDLMPTDHHPPNFRGEHGQLNRRVKVPLAVSQRSSQPLSGATRSTVGWGSSTLVIFFFRVRLQ